ncbi:MAG: tetratricopeptide repeat protein, partial [Planctomycetes bacterium]|nr:tetratricopeptide repeat protein [Planctomycetota bacterium]
MTPRCPIPLARARSRSEHARTLLFTVLFLALGLFCLGSAIAVGAEVDPPDAQLLRGELLEVSRGDLDGAMAIYRELIAAEGTSDAIRAKALLKLARCHRKRGELEAARGLLEQLVTEHAEQAGVIEEAEGFLREIRAGRSDNPDFDWVGALLESPEFQDRIVGHVLAMVGDTSESEIARQKLAALGEISVPALERFHNTTRDVAHRIRIARLLVELGRWEYLSSAVSRDIGSFPASLAEALLAHVGNVSSTSSTDIVRTVVECDCDNASGQIMLALLRVATGADPARISEDFSRVVPEDRSPFMTWELFGRALETLARGPHGMLLTRVEVDPGVSRSQRIATVRLLSIMVRNGIEPTRKQWSLLRNPNNDRSLADVEVLVEHWVSTGNLEVIATVFAEFGERILKDWRDYSPELRADLARIAIDKCEASPLYTWAAEDAETAAWAAEFASADCDGPRRVQELGSLEKLVTATMANRFAPLLEARDLYAKFIAVSVLGQARDGVGPEVTSTLARIANDSGEDPVVRTASARALLVRLQRGWPQWRESLRSVEEFLQNDESIDRESSPLADLNWERERRRTGRRSRNRFGDPSLGNWVTTPDELSCFDRHLLTAIAEGWGHATLTLRSKSADVPVLPDETWRAVFEGLASTGAEP